MHLMMLLVAVMTTEKLYSNAYLIPHSESCVWYCAMRLMIKVQHHVIILIHGFSEYIIVFPVDLVSSVASISLILSEPLDNGDV